jgi:hypothetical protein
VKTRFQIQNGTSCLPDTCCKDGYHQDPSPPGQLQLPDGYHGKNKDRKVRNHVKDPRSQIQGIDIDAVAGGHQWIPDPLPWVALVQLYDDIQKIENTNDPDNDLYGHEQRHVGIAIGNKDSQILKEDGKLDQGDDDAVENACDVDPLGRD